MSKIMPLALLSSIKGARSSEAVEELFETIRKAVPVGGSDNESETNAEAVSLEDLRSDQIERCPEHEKELIRKNFPESKNGFLVVSKVIED